MDKKLQDYADIGKDLLKKDGHWDTALDDLEKKRKPSISKWVLIGLVSLVIILISFLIYNNQNKVEPTHYAYFEAVPTSLVPNVRADNGAAKTELEKAVIAYGDKHFEEAESLLKPLLQSESKDLAKLYLASIYISQNKCKEATALLNQIQNRDLNDYVQWYTAISLLPHDPEKAKTLLTEIAGDQRHFRAKRAREILKKEFSR